MSEPETMKINEVEYVRKDSIALEPSIDEQGLTCCIVRTYSAGVFMAYVKYEQEETFLNLTLKNALRLWKWAGAFSLSELAVKGTTEPDNCRFAREIVPEMKINRVIEIIPITKEVEKNLLNAKRG